MLFSKCKTQKIFILQGNPVKDGVCDMIAQSYMEGAKSSGREVRFTQIRDMQFDPILHDGYEKIQELEPDLKKIQEDLKWCDHFVLCYPTWWSAMPALLKGMFDRMWLPGFAFHFNKNGMGWQCLLKGRTGRVFVTMDSWPMIERIFFGDSTNEIDRAILEFSGIKPTRVKMIGPVKTMSDKKKDRLKTRVYRMGQKGQ